MRRLLPRGSLSRVLPVLLAACMSAAMAQDRPPRLEPLPEPPPPPPMPGLSDPGVRIPVPETDKIEEIREGGRVTMIRVTPPNGVPYYLIDTSGNGNWMRRDGLDSGYSPPMWQIRTFD